jgi:hypothetical protein
MKDAAHRHHDAANKLHDENKRAAAAYLYGLAAECAVKALLEKQGVRPQADARKSDPYYAHFPELRALLEDTVRGRGAALFNPFLRASFMNEWDITLRYAPNREIIGDEDGRVRRYDRWKTDANTAISQMQAYL